MTIQELVSTASENIPDIPGKEELRILKPYELPAVDANQFLFFLKPECFPSTDATAARKGMQLIFEALRPCAPSLSFAALASGSNLAKYKVIDKHYGEINRLSRCGVDRGDPLYIEIVRTLERGDNELPILGGHQILDRFPSLTAETLNSEWQKVKAVKVKSGVYVQMMDIGNFRFIGINGFHPQQVEYYTKPDHILLALILESRSPWAFIRNSVLGDTFPERAEPSSIRGHLYRVSEKLNLGRANITRNFAHMSAGPIEALFEMENFIARQPHTGFKQDTSVIGRRLASRNLLSIIPKLITNPKITRGNETVDIFAATEHKDTQDALELATQYIQ